MSKRKRLRNIRENISEVMSQSTPFAYLEAFKALRTNLSFVSINGKYKKIILTSALPDEGKSTVAINLASSLAEAGAKVILLDCDLRNPSMHRYLKIDNRSMVGITNVLAGTVSFDSNLIFTDPTKKFDFMPSGPIPPNPAELLGSPRMDDLLKALSMAYDYILCDTPPVSVVTDAAALSKFCDGVLLVIRQKFASKEQVREAKKNLDTVQAHVMGAIMTYYDMTEDLKDSSNRYGYYKYEYSDH